MDPHLELWHCLSPHSVCKKSPNLLAALLPLTDLSLKQCWRWVRTCAGKGGFPRVIRPKKECIKSCETCSANTLNLNDKDPSLKSVPFPKSYSPLANWPWLRISPEFFVCYLLFDPYCLTMIDSFTCIPVQNEPNKSPLRKRLLALLLGEISHPSSPSRSCLGKLIFIRGSLGALRAKLPRTKRPQTLFNTFDQSQHLLRILHTSFVCVFSVVFLPFLK